ncbi:unnamed protein product, partial [Prorocentrum cordatum]
VRVRSQLCRVSTVAAQRLAPPRSVGGACKLWVGGPPRGRPVLMAASGGRDGVCELVSCGLRLRPQALTGSSRALGGAVPRGQGEVESLALAEGGSLLEVCELCYLLALARQAAREARLAPQERALLVKQARLLAAQITALAAAEDVALASALAQLLERQGRPSASEAASRPQLEVQLAGAPPPVLGAPGDGAGGGGGGDVGAALVGALAGAGAGGAGGAGAPPGAGPAGPGAALGVLGGAVVPAAGLQLGGLVDGAWTQASTLIGANWSQGLAVELPTHEATGAISGTALFEIDEVGVPGAGGQYLTAQFRGASLPAEAMRFDGAFPPLGGGPAGLLHLCAQGPARCGEPAQAGRAVLHVEWLRLRSTHGLVEPWVRPSVFGGRGGGAGRGGPSPIPGGAAAERLAAAAAAHALALGGGASRGVTGRGRRRARSESGSRSDGEGEPRFRDAPSRGGGVRLLAERQPGALCDEAMQNIARVMGLREGADGSETRPKVVGYLQAIVFGHHPVSQLRVNTVRELQTLATALGQLESGSLPQLSDVLMQRFKVLELSLSGAGWQVASELEIVPDVRPSLASMDEQDLARRSALLRRRLEEAKSRGAFGALGRARELSRGKGKGRGRGRFASGSASDLLREPYDVGPILLNLAKGFPGSFGRYVRDSLKPQLREHMATMGGRLPRDLLPLPYPTIVKTDVVRDGDDLSDMNWDAPHCRLVATVLALNGEAGFRSLKFARLGRRRPSAAQRPALAALGRPLYLATRIESGLPAELNWEDPLKDRKIGYGGAETTAPHELTLEQVLDGLLAPGVAASIEAAEVATGFVRDSLLDPGLMLLPSALSRAAPASARAYDAPVKSQDGVLRPVLRLISNLIPSRACQECIVGDAPEMPTMSQLKGLVLTESEDLVWCGADRKAFFYAFRAPPPWWPYMGIGPPVPSRLLGLKDGGTTHICLRVIGMGWISAAGVATHFHRNTLRRSSAVPRGLCPSWEIARRRRLPLGAEKSCPPAWVMVGNLEIAEVVDESEADKLRGGVPELLSNARACYEATGSPGSPGKDLHRVVGATTLGELVDGVEGVRRPPAGYIAVKASLALWVLGKRRASMQLKRILPGRWGRVHCVRRPLAASFAYTWEWLSDPRCGGRFSVSVIEDLLMCLALSGLCVVDMRLEVDHLVTASDSSEAAGAVVYSTALTERGCAVAGRRQRPANAAREEETALITVFDGIGGGRGAFEILGLAPAVHLPFRVDPQAVCVTRRAYPGTQHLGDVTSADPAALACLLRARGRVARAVVIGGFPCQIYTSLNVDRKGSSDSDASLVDHMVRVIRGLRAAMPESVDSLAKNVASMAESDVLRLSGLFERSPLEVEAGDVGWVRRPRLYWPSWDLLPSCEAKTVMVLTKDGASRRLCCVSLEVERPPLEEWPAGIGECTAAEIMRWKEAAFAAPPCQFHDKWCIHWPDGRIAPPGAVVREKLMGFAEGHAVLCMTSSEAEAEPVEYEGLRRSLVGNSFQCVVVAWLLAHWAVAAGLLVAMPPFSELHESARAWVGGRKLWAGDVASLRRSRAKVGSAVCGEMVARSAAASSERQRAGERPAAAAPATGSSLAYVVRGSRRWSLAPPCFGNPFAVSPCCSREDAVALFAGWLRGQPELLRHLGDLRGAKLVGHCSQSEACHADVLLTELARRDATSWRDSDVSRRSQLIKVVRSFSAWELAMGAQVPQRAPPMPPLVCSALAGWALGRGEIAFAATILAGFHLCLRTGEALGLSSGVIQLKPCGRGVVSLPWTKTACQKGARETVTLDDPLVGLRPLTREPSDATARANRSPRALEPGARGSPRPLE